MGFVQWRASPCIFHHPSKGLVTSVHGDDFTTAGPKGALNWFEHQMRLKYELTVGGLWAQARRTTKKGRSSIE